MALKGLEVVEFVPSPQSGEGTPISLTEGQGLSNTDTDDNPLVSGPVMPVMVPIELIIQLSGLKANYQPSWTQVVPDAWLTQP